MKFSIRVTKLETSLNDRRGKHAVNIETTACDGSAFIILGSAPQITEQDERTLQQLILAALKNAVKWVMQNTLKEVWYGLLWVAVMKASHDYMASDTMGLPELSELLGSGRAADELLKSLNVNEVIVPAGPGCEVGGLAEIKPVVAATLVEAIPVVEAAPAEVLAVADARVESVANLACAEAVALGDVDAELPVPIKLAPVVTPFEVAPVALVTLLENLRWLKAFFFQHLFPTLPPLPKPA
ncbi:hypothetical protein BJ508DRAFT_309347 [Ascobolus immersus RN42]|uniref:Uncharacterized protein n=1 Tax=Ascobolus immersus RN42 TaxID=1160509 RepID=A0A3N4I2T9_ASCIM|nr:hypothetical protein BJ508DRAFT_309347 [Ascobolus immersus RN42]